MYYQKANFDASTAHLIFQGGGNLQGSNDLDYYNVSFLSGNPGSLNEGNILNKVLFEDIGILNSYGIHIINEAEFQEDGFFNSNDSFETLKLAGGKIYTFQENTTQTINPTGTFLASGSSCNDFITFKSNNPGQQATISKTGSSLNFDYLLLSDINATGGATFNASNSIDLGNNSGWTITPTTSRDLFWVGGGGDWNDNNHWSLTSGGTGGTCIPSAYDNIFFDNNSGFTANSNVNVNLPLVYCNNMTWAGVQNTPTLTGSNAQSFNIYGSLIFDANMINQYPTFFTFLSTSPGNIIQSNGQFLGAIKFEGVGGEWTLEDDLNASILRHFHGTIFSNNKNITTGSWDASSSSTDAGLYLGSSNLTFPSFTYANMYYQKANFDASTAHLVFQNGGNLQGSNDLDYYNVSFLSGNPGSLNEGSILNKVLFEDVGILNSYGIHNIKEAEFQENGFFYSEDSFETLKLSAGKTYIFQANNTQTISSTGDFIAEGTGSFPIEIKSSQNGTQAIIQKDGDPICLDYLYLTDIKATGTGFSYVGDNSDDVFNNDGWIFQACPPCASMPATAPTLHSSSVTVLNSSQIATLVLDNLPAGHEAVWFDATQITEVYANTTNSFHPTITEPSQFYGATRDILTGCLSELLLVEIATSDNCITGIIQKNCGELVEGATVVLTGDINDVTQTDVNGVYKFSNIPSGSNVTVTPSKSMGCQGDSCINVLDKILIEQHILGINTLSTPYQYIAADINKTGTLTAFDMVQLNQFITGTTTSYPSNDCFRFVDAAFNFTSNNPAAENFPEIINVNGLSGTVQADFVAVQIGNVNDCCDSLTSSFLELSLDSLIENCDIDIASGVTWSVPVKVKNFNNITGLQFSLNWDIINLQYAGISNYNLPNLHNGNFGTTASNNGELTMIWSDSNPSGTTISDGTTIFNLELNILNPNSTTVSFDSNPTTTLVINQGLETSKPITQNGHLAFDQTNCPPICVDLSINDSTVCQGDQICLDVILDNFIDIASMQYSLGWDSTMLQFQSIQNLNLTDLSPGNFNTGNTSSGRLSFAWFDNTAQGITVPDGTSIYQICFNTLQNGTSTINFVDSPIPIEIVSPIEVECYNTQSSTITIESSPPPTLVCNDNLSFNLTYAGEQIILTPEIVLENVTQAHCGVDTIIISPNILDCSNLGINDIEVTMMDINGDTAICNTQVEITDTLSICSPAIECCNDDNSLIANGAFNGYSEGNIPGGSTPWTPVHNSPRITNTDGCDSIGSLQMWGNEVVGESVEQIGLNIQAGNTYRFNFCAKYVNSHAQAPLWAKVEIRAADGPLPYSGCVGNCEVVYETPEMSITEWEQYCIDWTPQFDYDRIMIRVINDQTLDNGNYVSRARIDDVCLELIEVAPPVCIACPLDTTVMLGQGETAAIVDYLPPVIDSSCTGYLVDCYPPAGSEFLCGTTPVYCYIYDSLAMDWDTCIFNVIVDCSNTCQVDFDWNLDESCLKVNFDTTNIIGGSPSSLLWTFPDNTTSTLTNPMWTAPDTGAYEICLEMIDANGCKDTLCQAVGIYDEIWPEIGCPSDTIVYIPACEQGANLNFTTPFAYDNCAVDSVWCEYPINNFYPCGNTEVQCYARDIYGNLSSCSFNVTVVCERANIFKQEIMCGDSAAGYDFCIWVANPNGANSSDCSISITSPLSELTIDQKSVVWTNDTAKITGSIGSTRPIPSQIHLKVTLDCACPAPGNQATSRLMNAHLNTPCCDSIYIEGQEVCGQDASLYLGLNGSIDVNNIAQTIWYVNQGPCPNTPTGGTPYQTSIGYSDLLILPNYYTSNLCVYAEVIMANGPCTKLTTNLDTIEICKPITCALTDTAYCYAGTPIIPEPLCLALNQNGQDCEYSIIWLDENGDTIPGETGLKYQPPAIDFVGAADACAYEVTYTAIVNSVCGNSTCTSTIRLDNDNAATGQLSISYPSHAMPFCPGQDATINYEPACVGEPPMWNWHSSEDGSSFTPIPTAGTQNPVYNTNRLFKTTWFMVTKQNGVCTTMDTTIIKIEIKDSLKIAQFAAQSLDACRMTGVQMDVAFNPCNSGTANSCDCDYNIKWYKNGQVIHTDDYTSSPATFNYVDAGLSGDYSGNYYAVVSDNCCDQRQKTTVIPISPPMEVLAVGPCFQCFDEQVTLGGIVENSTGSCTYQWYLLNGGIETPVTGGNTQDIQVTIPGTYIFEAICGGCTDRSTFVLNQCNDVCETDNVMPTAICTDGLSVSLDSDGQAEIFVTDVDDGSFDNCIIDTMYLDQYIFDCDDIGMNEVMLTVVDAHGNQSICLVTVTIQDEFNNCSSFCTMDTIALGPIILAGTEVFAAKKVVITESTIAIGSDITLQAKDKIEFKVGFHALPGSKLLAKIEDCTIPFTEPEKPQSSIKIGNNLHIINDIHLKIQPNPFRYNTTLVVNLPNDQVVNLRVFDQSGRMVMELLREESLAKGIHEIPMQANQLKGGMYYINLPDCNVLR